MKFFQNLFENYDRSLVIFINFLIFSALILVLPIVLIFTISLLKPQIKKHTTIYLYAFSCTLLILVGGFLIFDEANHKAAEALENFTFTNSFLANLTKVSLIVGGALLGIVTIFVVRTIIAKKWNKSFANNLHYHAGEHDTEDHFINYNEIKNPKQAWIALLLLLSHRTVDSLIVGSFVYKMSVPGDKLDINYALIVTFVLHIFVEIFIIYYRQVQYGYTKKKAVVNNLISTLIMLPLILVSAYVYPYLNRVGLIIPFLNASAGSVLIFVALVEFVPEFITYRAYKNVTEKKVWNKVILFLSAGILFSLTVLGFHQHDDHDHENSANKTQVIKNENGKNKKSHNHNHSH